MKYKTTIAFSVGLIIGAGFIWVITNNFNSEISETEQQLVIDQANRNQKSIFDLDSLNQSLLAFDPASEDSLKKWIKDFRKFNNNLANVQMQLEPSIWSKGDLIEYAGGDIDCGIDYWYISKSDFDDMYDTQECKGFKIYPAIRNVNVRNTTGGDNFDHDGFTLVFTPTDEYGNNLVDTNNVIRGFEYVDPCPTMCKNDMNDLITRSGLSRQTCN